MVVTSGHCWDTVDASGTCKMTVGSNFQSCNLILLLEEWTVIYHVENNIQKGYCNNGVLILLSLSCGATKFPTVHPPPIDHLIFELCSVTLCVLSSFGLVESSLRRVESTVDFFTLKT